MAVYNFTKSPVNIDRLKLEIDVSSIATANFEYANYSSPNLDIYFDGDLSGTDQTTLNTIVTNHTGAPIYVSEGWVAIANGSGGLDYINVLDPEVVTTSGVTTHFNLDGGRADSIYGGTSSLDGGTAFTTF